MVHAAASLHPFLATFNSHPLPHAYPTEEYGHLAASIALVEAGLVFTVKGHDSPREKTWNSEAQIQNRAKKFEFTVNDLKSLEKFWNSRQRFPSLGSAF